MPLTAPEAIERLIRIEAKVDSHLYRTDRHEARLDAHDVRIRDVEKGHAKTIGVAAGASAVVSLLSTWAHKLFGG